MDNKYFEGELRFDYKGKGRYVKFDYEEAFNHIASRLDSDIGVTNLEVTRNWGKPNNCPRFTESCDTLSVKVGGDYYPVVTTANNGLLNTCLDSLRPFIGNAYKIRRYEPEEVEASDGSSTKQHFKGHISFSWQGEQLRLSFDYKEGYDMVLAYLNGHSSAEILDEHSGFLDESEVFPFTEGCDTVSVELDNKIYPILTTPDAEFLLSNTSVLRRLFGKNYTVEPYKVFEEVPNSGEELFEGNINLKCGLPYLDLDIPFDYKECFSRVVGHAATSQEMQPYIVAMHSTEGNKEKPITDGDYLICVRFDGNELPAKLFSADEYQDMKTYCTNVRKFLKLEPTVKSAYDYNNESHCLNDEPYAVKLAPTGKAADFSSEGIKITPNVVIKEGKVAAGTVPAEKELDYAQQTKAEKPKAGKEPLPLMYQIYSPSETVQPVTPQLAVQEMARLVRSLPASEAAQINPLPCRGLDIDSLGKLNQKQARWLFEFANVMLNKPAEIQLEVCESDKQVGGDAVVAFTVGGYEGFITALGLKLAD